MSSVKQSFRPNPLFKEVLALTRPDHLVIRQIAPEAYIVVTPRSASETEWIVATARNPDEPRTFVSIGAAVLFAIDLSGIPALRFELLAGRESEEPEG